ncbi:hypothetical protein, partial [Herbaspirillum frisingense]
GAGGAGSSGGGSSSSNSGSGGAGAGNGTAAAGSVDPAPAVIKGGVALGSISNANITAYDEQGKPEVTPQPDAAIKPDTAAKPEVTAPKAAPTAADLQLLGVDISGKTAAQQEAILAAIGTSGADGKALNSVPALETLVAKAVAALDKITNYAKTNMADAALGAPTVADYRAMGVAKVTDTNLAAVNAALASKLVTDTQADIFGTINPTVLEKDEEVIINTPNGLTAADFLSRLKAAAALSKPPPRPRNKKCRPARR